MATKLEKDLTRESTILVDGKEILVTITADQKISMKLKGQRGGSVVSIGIGDLHSKLSASDNTPTDRKSNDTMVPLGDLRDKFLISNIPYEQKVVFSRFVKEILNKL